MGAFGGPWDPLWAPLVVLGVCFAPPWDPWGLLVHSRFDFSDFSWKLWVPFWLNFGIKRHSMWPGWHSVRPGRHSVWPRRHAVFIGRGGVFMLWAALRHVPGTQTAFCVAWATFCVARTPFCLARSQGATRAEATWSGGGDIPVFGVP